MRESIGLRPDPKLPAKPNPIDRPDETAQSDLGIHLPDDSVSPAPPGSDPTKNRRRRKILLIGLIILGGLGMVEIITSLLFAPPQIILQNVPAGARIIFDGQATQLTRLTATPGIHYLKISQPGYISLDKQIRLSYFQRFHQDARLRPLPQARQIASQEIFSLSQDEQNAVYYLDGSARTIFQLKIDANGEAIKTALTPALTMELDRVIFSPDFSLAILKLNNGQTGMYDFKRYDLLHQEYHPWGDNIGEVLWRQDGQKALYWQELVSGRKMLTLANKDNSDQQNLIFLDEYGIEAAPLLDWTNDQKTVLLVADSSLYLFDLEAKTAPSPVVQGGISDAKFTPDNQKMVFTHNGDLKIVAFERSDPLGQSSEEMGKFSIQPIRELGIKASAQKAILSSDSQRMIAYAENKGLVEIELDSKKIREFNYENKAALSIESLQMSPDEKTLFFLTQDKKLMSLILDKGEY